MRDVHPITKLLFLGIYGYTRLLGALAVGDIPLGISRLYKFIAIAYD